MNQKIKHKLEQIKNTRKWISQGETTYNPIHVKEIGNTNWFIQSDASLSYNSSKGLFVSSLTNQQHVYLSYKELNTDFSQSPSEKYLNLNINKKHNVEFKGKVEGRVSIILSIIQYKENQKVSTINVELNKLAQIELEKNSDSFRVAIKVKGNGSFVLDTVSIGNVSLWNGNSIKNQKYLKLENTDWYIPNTSKVQYNKFSSLISVNLGEKEHIYIPYNEANVDFAAIPQNPVLINNESLSIAFKGEKDHSVDVKLFIILYDEKERREVQQIELNSKRFFPITKDVKNMRLAIRITGNGSLKITDIVVSGMGYWRPEHFSLDRSLSINAENNFPVRYNDLRFPKGDNRIIYHKKQSLFESTLNGNQYVYLECFDQKGINNPPINPIFTPQKGCYYDFLIWSEVYKNVQLTMFVAGFRNNKRIELYQIPFNKRTKIKFHNKTDSVKFFVRVSGEGYFKNINLSFNEKTIEITNKVELDLNSKLWFSSNKKLVNLYNEENCLAGEAKVSDGKRIYSSYKETNNSFNYGPTNEIMPINTGYEYEIHVKATIDEGLELLPMLVGYEDGNKKQALQLKLNSPMRVKFNPNINSFRFAIRLAGIGNFKIENITIIEIPTIKTNKTMEWVDSKEVSHLGLVEPKPLNKLKMAVIFDEFTTASYKHECELVTFSPDNWLETLVNNKPDILMVESAWYGNGGTWNKRVGYYGEENMESLYSLLNWCNQQNIPTVFWNKEDPVHFNRFIETAKRFDYIFTTDENMVAHYKEEAGHENVYSLPFAAQPVIHNPVKIMDKRENKACFAGSYYRHHEERSKDMDRVLDNAAKHGLEIFDRNYEKTKQGLMPNHRFPDRFESLIKGSLKYYEIDKAYKGYSVMINVNTVKDSPTMFSRRVFEGLACGTPVVSTYAQGIESIFGELVYISEDEKDIDNAFDSLINNQDEYRNKSVKGIREVLSKHTYSNRLQFIVDKVGLSFNCEAPKITIIAFAHNKLQFNRAVVQFERQKYANKELVILTDTFEGYLELFNTHNTGNIKTFVRSYMHNYQNILEWIETPYIAYFSSEDYYGENYLSDLMLCTTFTNSDFIGKATYFAFDQDSQTIRELNEDNEYEYVTTLAPSRSIVKTNTLAKKSLKSILIEIEDNTPFSNELKFGKAFYSNDKFNYISNDLSGEGEGYFKKRKQIEL
jgi:spore maturation protein CgeB